MDRGSNAASRVMHREPCPYCRAGGGDTTGDNLAVYLDGHKHCYSCGRHEHAPTWDRVKDLANQQVTSMPVRVELKFPEDYMPLGTALYAKAAISWLRKYGINDGEIKKWKLGWSSAHNLLVFPVFKDGEIIMWQGRNFGDGPKYLTNGLKHDILYPVGNDESGVCIMVEDFISALRVGRLYQAAPLWGSDMALELIKKVADSFDVMGVWLDPNKTKEAVKIALRASQYIPTFVVTSHLDPKDYDNSRIKDHVEIAGHDTLYKEAPPIDKRAFSEHADPELDQFEENSRKFMDQGPVKDHPGVFYDMNGEPIDLSKIKESDDCTLEIADPTKGNTHGS